MATELQTTLQDFPPVTYDVRRELIEALAEKYLTLTVKGINDKRGLRAVEKGRIELHDLQRAIEHRRKDLKAPLLEYERTVDGGARELRQLIEPIEGHLREQVEAITRERTRLERQSAENRRATIIARVNALGAVGYVVTPADVGPLTDEEFEAKLEHARANPKLVVVTQPANFETAAKIMKAAGIHERAGVVDVGLPPAGIANNYEPGAALSADFAQLLHVANQVALITVPAVATAKGMEAAVEIETLLSNCVDRIRAAANLLQGNPNE
jgi:hypothetical protein